MTQTDDLTASDGVTYNDFGTSVSISSNTVVVGATLAAICDNANQGAAYVFVTPPPTFSSLASPSIALGTPTTTI